MLALAPDDVDETEDYGDQQEDEKNLQRQAEEYGADFKDHTQHGHGYDEHDGDGDPTKNLLYIHNSLIYYADVKGGGTGRPGLCLLGRRHPKNLGENDTLTGRREATQE